MKVLILNGSPRGKQSNTLIITNAFMDGLKQASNLSVKQVNIYDNTITINHCAGCFHCWTKTPGKCVFNDSMGELLSDYIEADLVIWSFPLYYFGLPSKAKAFMDRMLPINTPLMTPDRAGHIARHDLSHQKTILIASGGLSTIENNFEALDEQFKIMYGANFSKIYVPQSPLLEVEELNSTTSQYLHYVQKAGFDFIRTFQISSELQEKLNEPLFPINVYNKMADASWEIADASDESSLKLRSFTKQMAALYNPDSYCEDIFLEFAFTDYQENYQIQITKEGATVVTEHFKPYTTKIETPFSVWSDISKGKISGASALMAGKYKVNGNLDLMMKWDHYFGNGIEKIQHSEQDQKTAKNFSQTNMNMMLLPWIIFWVSLPFHNLYGGIATLLVCLSLPLVFSNIKFTFYDKISTLANGALAILAMVGYQYQNLIPLSYLLFSMLWLGSLFTPIALTAHYSNTDFGGDSAFQNPIFMKTNQILTICWGILYLFIAGFTLFAVTTDIQPYLVLINNLPPALLGIFTKWFKDWYPKKIIAGR